MTLCETAELLEMLLGIDGATRIAENNKQIINFLFRDKKFARSIF